MPSKPKRRKSHQIQFHAPDGKRRSITVPGLTKAGAQHAKSHIKQLVAARIGNVPPPDATSHWLAGAGDLIRHRLADYGVITLPKSRTLSEFATEFLSERSGLKARTLINDRATIKCLISFFGEERLLRSIDRDEAHAWRASLAVSRRPALSENSIRGRVKVAKTLFNAAKKRGLVDVNPFEGLSSNIRPNASRSFYVSADTINEVIACCPSADWELVFALARFGGLRCPSEPSELRWEDIDWEGGRFSVRCVKTEGRDGHGVRVMAMCPDLRRVLERAYRQPDRDRIYVLTDKLRGGARNWRTTAHKVILRAGHEPWPKLFQNLRASLATDLVRVVPDHVAANMLGHSPKVANEHYRQVTESDFATVARGAEPVGRAAAPLQQREATGRIDGKTHRRELQKRLFFELKRRAREKSVPRRAGVARK